MLELTFKEKVRLLRERFVNRTDTYAIQWLSRESNDWRFWRVTEGKCPTKCAPGTCTHKTNVPLKDKQFAEHLSGERTLGVYQLSDDDKVKWLCLDVDINKGVTTTNIPSRTLTRLVREHTKCLAIVTKRLDVPFLVEFSGNRGYHIWIFFSEPVTANHAMSLGRFINDQVEPPTELHVEVFPKQTSQGSFGNLVKLPLGVHQKTNQNCFFVDSSFEPIEDQWRALAKVPLVSAQTLEELLTQHDIPIIDTVRLEARTGAGKMALPCMSNIMAQGAGQGKRDIVTFKLSCFLKNAGIPSDLALATIEEWNMKNLPPLDSGTLAVKVQSAYNQDYSSFPCQDKQFDEFCSPTCRFYAEKMRTRGNKEQST